ncbi:hypothetical protein HAX54_041968, partial [Datura stramonium]|nr:hypothetical protein [Datura stramonium]
FPYSMVMEDLRDLKLSDGLSLQPPLGSGYGPLGLRVKEYLMDHQVSDGPSPSSSEVQRDNFKCDLPR